MYNKNKRKDAQCISIIATRKCQYLYKKEKRETMQAKPIKLLGDIYKVHRQKSDFNPLWHCVRPDLLGFPRASLLQLAKPTVVKHMSAPVQNIVNMNSS